MDSLDALATSAAQRPANTRGRQGAHRDHAAYQTTPATRPAPSTTRDRSGQTGGDALRAGSRACAPRPAAAPLAVRLPRSCDGDLAFGTCNPGGPMTAAIERLELFAYDLTYVGGEYVMSGGRVVRRLSSTVVRITTADGRTGYGETCP